MIITKHTLKRNIEKASIDINIGYTDKELIRNIKLAYLRYGMNTISLEDVLDELIVDFILLVASEDNN